MASEGAFSFSDVYDMPTYLRRFYIKELEEWKKQQREFADPKHGSLVTPPPIKKVSQRTKK
jgi:hypothetical protein